MTNRKYIQKNHRIPSAIVRLLQPFYSFDVSRVPLIPSSLLIRFDFLSNGKAIYISSRRLRNISTAALIGGLAHELEHVRQRRELGAEWYMRIAMDTARSIIQEHRLYSHDLSLNEQEAMQKEWEVWSSVEKSYQTWKNLLDEECEESEEGGEKGGRPA